MPFLDRTVDFRNAVEVQRAVIPETNDEISQDLDKIKLEMY